ncbi:hypothetical protein BJ138DRAFT_1153312 [Hygrophoropsis aurantiaca]|uniref:Uncharacterized protein n=1 Tax=Hygrophoropsis aurantiaca TaxID=72124 RepID=A0ACB8AAG5_9AGAM|nr:hypothetical protein BJ138DRAFT_1153312 [Hygrophoropsis aurantiaca]
MHRIARAKISHLQRPIERNRPCLSAHKIAFLRPYTTDIPPLTPFESINEEVDLEERIRDDIGYPDLMTSDPFLDPHDSKIFAPTRRAPFQNRVTIRNDPSLFTHLRDEENAAEQQESKGPAGDEEDELSPLAHLPLSKSELNGLYKFPLLTRRITQQTGKGKIHRMYTLVVVGNGDGLVGYGEGKDDEVPRATDKAFAQAVRNMDYVERFEKRTLWTEMDSKLGATHIILRPRPVGFGLRCNPNVHQVLKAAGIKDASAKVWGSRNPLSVIKTLFRMLHAGNAPLAMGDGIGGRARRLDKGSGLRSKDAVERERGRKLVDLRTW